MNPHRPFKRIAIAGLGAVLLSAGASALADPPSRIARLAYVTGPVSFAGAGDNDWRQASLNRPLVAGDRLWNEAGARDEVQLGAAALRMGADTLVTLLNVDDRSTQLQLSQGRLNVRVRQLRPNDVFEIDTPNLALTIRQPGDYRIEVDPAGNATMVAVRRGQAEAYGDGNAYRIGAGQAYSFGGTDLRAAPPRPAAYDEFDRWSDTREQRLARSTSARYVSPDLVGFEDLDEQGSWRTVPNYGNVWMPRHVSRDWAPYRDGHWAYVQPWGWTWVDDAPWGFAVSHYGRWARLPEGWGWVPGPRAASPVYAPALVAFVSVGAGAYAQRERPVAWFPLAPREVYRPAYRASPTYITNINITNTTLVRNQIGRDDRRADYANRRVGGAVTAMPATAFVHAQPVSRAAMAIPAAVLAAAAIAHTAPVAPERDRTHGRGNPGHQPPPALMARQVLARTAPPPLSTRAPVPAAHGALVAVPAPRMLAQDRHGSPHQLRDVPVLAAAPAVQQPNSGRFDRHDPRPNAGQAVTPLPAPVREPERNRIQQEQQRQQQEHERQQQKQQQEHQQQGEQNQQRQRQEHEQQQRKQQEHQQQDQQRQQQKLQQEGQQRQQHEHEQQQQKQQQERQQDQQNQQRQRQEHEQQQRKQQEHQQQDQQRQRQEQEQQQRKQQERQQQDQQRQQQHQQQKLQQEGQHRQQQEHEQQQQKQQQERHQQQQQKQDQERQQHNQQQQQQQQKQQQERQQQQKQQEEQQKQNQQQHQEQQLKQQQQHQAEQQQRERQQQLRQQQHAPAPQPPAAVPVPPKPAPEQAKAVPPAPQAAGQGKGHDGRKDDRRHRDHPEQQ